ncbi:MAG: hypothetical protein [Wigfec virus K19_83]|nr:MAG: hypothetical protein [Wigfec virus K19_83]
MTEEDEELVNRLEKRIKTIQNQSWFKNEEELKRDEERIENLKSEILTIKLK